jgi:beta-galactosidase/beta-glucuronidase
MARKQKQPQTLVASVFDADGNSSGSNRRQSSLAPGVTAPYFLRITVPKPHLWNGRKDPYLYKAVVELRAADGGGGFGRAAARPALLFG